MIRIEVVSISGEPPPQPNSANFGAAGGTIGRASTNSLVLPDPTCFVSRVHAQVSTVDNRAVITDQSINALLVNDKPLGKGNSVELSPGDRIVVGSYVLVVKGVDGRTAGIPVVSLPPQQPVPEAEDPFADLLGPTPTPAPSVSPPPSGRPSAAPASQASSSFPGSLPADFDPFSDPMQEPPPKPSPANAPAAHSLLDDFGIGAPVPSGGSGGSSLDDMFGLSSGPSSDPFAGSKLGDPAAGAGGPGIPDDPLAGIMGTAPTPRGRDSASNHLPEFQSAFTPPKARSEALSAPPPPAPKPADPFLSWGDEDLAAPPPAPSRPQAPVAPPPAAAPRPAPVPPRAAPPAPAPRAAAPVVPAPQASSAPAVRSSSGGEAALLDAFLSGLGISSPDLPNRLTPELMERVGQLLRESVQGTLDLLLARATTKREMRAEVTMIVSRGNNPLKFSPDVNTALTHLIKPLGHGFLPPLDALRDAQNDLRAHQFGVMAGMRAAFTSVLQQFAPQRLESRLSQKSFLDALLPVNRKAKLWELFHELYGEISQEAEEDFQNLFGREFLKAYESQIQRLEGAPPGRPSPPGNP